MVDTIQKALYPLRIVSFFLGLGILKGSLNHPKRRLSILYIFTVWFVYVYLIYQIVLSQIAIHFLGYFMVLVNLFVTLISIIIATCVHENIEMCVKKIALVDDTLEELGTLKEYRKMRNSAMWLLFMWLGIICVTLIGDSLWCIEMYGEIWTTIIPFVMDYSMHVNTFIDMAFMFLMRYVGTRLDKINEHILQLSESDECGLRCIWGRSISVTRRFAPDNAKYRRRVLWIAMHLHSELCRITRNINYLFGIQMTLQMMSYFVFLTSIIYLQYNTMICLHHTVANHMISVKLFTFSIIWCTIFVIKFISTNHICENVSMKARKTKEVVHKLTNLIYFKEARDEIYQFMLQLSLRPLKISGLHLFYFGYNFMYKFFVQILTFIIIMIQTNYRTLIMTPLSKSNNISCSV